MSVLSGPREEGTDFSVAEAEAEFERAQAIGDALDELEGRAVWLDAEFDLPYTDRRVGVSSIVGLLPGGGDGLMALVAATLVYRGIRLGAPTRTLAWMSIILVVEGVVSVVPLLGDAISLLWPANVNNVGRLRKQRDSLDGTTNWWFVLLLLSPQLLFTLAVVSLL